MFDNSEPNNSPFGQPQNPFDPSVQTGLGFNPVDNKNLKVPASVASSNNKLSQPDDIFGESEPTKDALSSGSQASSQLPNFNQVSPISNGPIFGGIESDPNQSGQVGGNYDEEIFGGRKLPWSKVITIGLMVGAGLLVLAGVIFVINYFLRSLNYGDLKNYNFNKEQNEAENINRATSSIPRDDSTGTSEIIEGEIEQEIDDRNRDSDGDGLTDREESETYNTKINNPDTDDDGLTDWAEAMIYKSDPLNPDTDGDGYKDGYEVINNYNPLDATPGAKLWNVPGL